MYLWINGYKIKFLVVKSLENNVELNLWENEWKLLNIYENKKMSFFF